MGKNGAGWEMWSGEHKCLTMIPPRQPQPDVFWRSAFIPMKEVSRSERSPDFKYYIQISNMHVIWSTYVLDRKKDGIGQRVPR
jgi:hypothetical protein